MDGHRLKSLYLAFITTLLLCSGTFAEPLKSIGKKDYSNDNLSFHLSDELYRSFSQANYIFQETDITYNIGFKDFIEFQTKWSRRVYNSHDEKPGTIGPDDKSKFLTVNTVYSKLKAGMAYGPIKIGPRTEYGVVFSIGKHVEPDQTVEAKQSSPVAEAQIAVVAKDELSKIMVDGKCTFCVGDGSYVDKMKQFFKNLWLGSVDRGENLLQWLIAPFAKDEKADEYNKEPLFALKQSAIFGLPVDVNVFTDEDNRLGVGDIVKHTAFLTFKPVSVGVGVSSFLDSSSDIFLRYIEEISIEKQPNSIAKVQVRFIKSYGGNITFAKLHTDFPIGPKYTFMDWHNEDADNYQKIFTFNFDLNTETGKLALRDILEGHYILNFIDVNSDGSQFKDLPEGVEFINTSRNRFERLDKSYFSTFPRVRKTVHQNLKSVGKEVVEDAEDTRLLRYSAENLLNEEKMHRGWKHLYTKRDKTIRTHIKTNSSPGYELFTSLDAPLNSFVLTFTNYAKNRYSRYNFISDIISLDKKVLDGSTNDLDYVKLSEVLKKSKQKEVEFHYMNQLSFHRKHLERILTISDEQIYLQAARMFLGEDLQRQWLDNRKEWDKGSEDLFSRASQRLTAKYGCRSAWPNEYLKHLSRQSLEIRTCSKIYIWVNRLVESLAKARESNDPKVQMKYLLNKLERLDLSPAMQLLLARLAGGYTDNNSYEGIRFTSQFFTPSMIQPLTHSNGTSYDFPFNDPLGSIKDIEYVRDSPDRLRQIEFLVDEDSSISNSSLHARMISLGKFENAPEAPMQVLIKITEDKPINQDVTIENYFLSLPAPVFIQPAGSKPYYLYSMILTPPSGQKTWFDTLKPGKRYVVHAQVISNNGDRISEASLIGIRIPKN